MSHDKITNLWHVTDLQIDDSVTYLGGSRDVRPFWTKISSFSCSFREKLVKWYAGASPPWLALPRENPGSATVMLFINIVNIVV